MKIILILILFAVVVGLPIHHALALADTRAAEAQEWSGSDARFTAVGMLNTTLSVTLADSGPVQADAFLDSVNGDLKMREELRAAGFKTMSCAGREITL